MRGLYAELQTRQFPVDGSSWVSRVPAGRGQAQIYATRTLVVLHPDVHYRVLLSSLFVSIS